MGRRSPIKHIWQEEILDPREDLRLNFAGLGHQLAVPQLGSWATRLKTLSQSDGLTQKEGSSDAKWRKSVLSLQDMGASAQGDANGAKNSTKLPWRRFPFKVGAIQIDVLLRCA